MERVGSQRRVGPGDGPLEVGGTVEVRANYRAVYHCLIRRFEPGRAIELVVRPVGLHIINIYEVEPAARRPIRHAFEVSGCSRR